MTTNGSNDTAMRLCDAAAASFATVIRAICVIRGRNNWWCVWWLKLGVGRKKRMIIPQ